MTRLAMIRGDESTWDITLVDGDGDPLGLAGLDITFTARRSVELGELDPVDGTWSLVRHDLELVKTVGDGLDVGVDPTAGILTLTIDPADTEDWTDSEITGPFAWDIEVKSGDDVRTPMRGVLVISPDVTVPIVS